MSRDYQCHSISQPRPDAFISTPDLTIKRLKQTTRLPTCLPVAHQTAINIQQVSLVSNWKRIRQRSCEHSRRGFSCEYLLAQICNVMLLSHKCSCQRNFLLIRSGWGINKEVWSKNTSKAYQCILDGKYTHGGWIRPCDEEWLGAYSLHHFPCVGQEGKFDSLSSPLSTFAAAHSFISGNRGNLVVNTNENTDENDHINEVLQAV